MNLSKSTYTTGVQCAKALWLQENNSDVLTSPDATALARFENGKIVGKLACELFTSGEQVPYNSTNYDAMIGQTEQWIQDGIEYIYEATFSYAGILIMVDILKSTPDGIEIYEVKSSTEIKDIYYDDVSIQKYVLSNLGFNVINSYIVHLDNTYIRGEYLNINALFSITNTNEEVDLLQVSIPSRLHTIQKHMSNRKDEPNIEIGKHCKHPYTCNAKEYCWKIQRGIPDYSLFNIFNLGSKKQLDLYSHGVVNIDDIPSDYPMTAIQEQKVFNHKSKTTFIDKQNIQDFLDILSYPIYHLDFETFQQAIPEWEGISPYQQIPFQYSLHIQYENGTIEHKEFLAKEGEDPRKELSERLVEDIPANVTVLAYNMSFEKGVISKLSNRFEELATQLLMINENMHDLMMPFQKQHYVTPSMQGSYSIKYILPALIPHMETAYKELSGVQNGAEAMNAFAMLATLPIHERENIREGLKAYCKLDTLSMVKILKHLSSIADIKRRK